MSVLRSWFRTGRNHLLSVAFMNQLLLDGFKAPKFSRQDLDRNLEGRSECFLQNLSRIHREIEERGLLFIVANQQSMSFGREDIKGMSYREEAKLVRTRLSEQGVT